MPIKTIEKLKTGLMDYIAEKKIEYRGLFNYPGIGVSLSNPAVISPPSTLFEYLTFTFYEDEIAQGSGKGIPKTIVVDRDCYIDKVYVKLETAPGAGKTLTVDVNLTGATIFTTQANRPSVTGLNKNASGTPNMTYLSKDDQLTMDIDVHDGSSDKLSVYIRCYKKM